MGKTRDLFKKLEKPREHFTQRWALRISLDLTEAYEVAVARIHRRIRQKRS